MSAYGDEHQLVRAAWAKRIENVTVLCVLDGCPIRPGEPWDITRDGPAHRGCARRRRHRPVDVTT